MTKTKTTSIALFLLFAMTISLFVLPSTSAQTQNTGTKKTYPFAVPIINPIGVGQQALIWTGITDACGEPAPGWIGLTMTVTKPDNTTETLGPFNTDETGATGVTYTPTVAGTYYFQVHFPQQVNTYAQNTITVPAGTLMLASDSDKIPLTVTAQPVPIYPGFPLPTEFWTNPINSQQREWASIADNFLYHAIPTDTRQGTIFLPYATQDPDTAHVLWTRNPGATEGALVGGASGDLPYQDGTAYEGTFTAFILDGILFRNAPWPTQSTYQSTTAIDLKTGKVLWTDNGTRITYVQTLWWYTQNMMGTEAYLWDTQLGTTWKAYEPYSGQWWYTMTNVPSGIVNYGPNGEILIYTVDLQHGWMTKWNSTTVEYNYYKNLYGANNPELFYWAGRWRPYGLTLDARLGYDYNVTIPKNLPGAVIKVTNQTILGSNLASYGQDYSKTGTANGTVYMWAISTKLGQQGQLLWQTNNPVDGNLTYNIRDVSEIDGVFVEAAKETRQFYGYSLATGQRIWGPTDPIDTLDWVGLAQQSWVDCIAYGRFYTGSYSGVMHCFDVHTGKLLWNTTVNDPYTESRMGTNWCLGIQRIADGKVYIGYFEHSYNNPKSRGAPVLCIDAYTGQILWQIDMCTTYRDSLGILGDGVFVLQNMYDGLDYAIAKGPSAITVNAPDTTNEVGSPITIHGMVTDISPGTQNNILPMRFPNGVPAVSDDSMSAWMEYVYMQYPRPTNVTGVEVTLSVTDSNNNTRLIGTTTSDEDGFYSFQWSPDIGGKYTVTASFSGSKAYYPSQAESAFVASYPPQASPTSQAQVSSPPFEMYVVGGVAAIIIAIAIVGAVLLLAIRKRP